MRASCAVAEKRRGAGAAAGAVTAGSRDRGGRPGRGGAGLRGTRRGRGVGHHGIAERGRAHGGELLGDAPRGAPAILGGRCGRDRLAGPAGHRLRGDAAHRLVAVIERAGQRALRGGGGTAGECQRRGAGHARVPVGEGRPQGLLDGGAAGESELEHGAAADERTRVAERREQARLGRLAGERRHGVERRAPHRRPGIGELARGHVRDRRLAQRGERPEERHLDLLVPLPPHRGGDQRGRGPGAHGAQGIGGTAAGVAVLRGQVLHRRLVERALGAALHAALHPDGLGAGHAEPPGGLEDLGDLAHRRVRRDGDQRRLVDAQPGRLGGGLPGAEPIDLGAQLGDEARQVGLLAGGILLAGSAVDAGLVDEAGEETLPLPLEQPDPFSQLRLPVARDLHLAAGAGQLGGGGGLPGAGAGSRLLLPRRDVARSRQLALQLGEPALEVDDLLERSSEQRFRISAQPASTNPSEPIGIPRPCTG